MGSLRSREAVRQRFACFVSITLLLRMATDGACGPAIVCEPTHATQPNVLPALPAAGPRCCRAAPEILMNGMQCTAAVDLFSFGGKQRWQATSRRRETFEQAAPSHTLTAGRVVPSPLAAAPGYLARLQALCRTAPTLVAAVLLYEIITGECPVRGEHACRHWPVFQLVTLRLALVGSVPW